MIIKSKIVRVKIREIVINKEDCAQFFMKCKRKQEEFWMFPRLIRQKGINSYEFADIHARTGAS